MAITKFLNTATFLAVICFVFTSCGGNDDQGKGGPVDPESPGLNITSIEKLNRGASSVNSHADVTSRSSLKMNFRSYVELGEGTLGAAKPNYPRIKQMSNGNYIMFFHNNQIGASCYYAVSQNLRSWSSKGKIFSNYAITDSKGNANERRFSNCDALVLSNGDILAAASYRANEGYRDLPADAGIILKRSIDNGISWSPAVEIYRGVNWEPYLVQLPSGEIHCYFTDSSRTGTEGNDTGTAMIVSRDNGNTWTPSFGNLPDYVIRTRHQNGFTNQMPVVIKLNARNELVAAVEAKNGNDNYNYYISLAYSGNDGEWQKVGANEKAPADRNDFAFKGCAPYLVQFPSGETVLSYNQSSTYHIKTGDAFARNFSNYYAPFPGKGFWGALELIDDHLLIGTMPNTGDGRVMLAQFVLNHRIEARHRVVKVDGGNSEWADTDHALFVGDRSQAQATLRCASDNDNVYFLVEVLDNCLSKNDYADIYISPTTGDDMLTGESCRIRLSLEGLKSSDVYNNGWTGSKLGVSVHTQYEGSVFDNSDIDQGYIAEVAVPRSKLNIGSGEILVNFSITDSQGGEDALSDTSVPGTRNWIPVTGL